MTHPTPSRIFDLDQADHVAREYALQHPELGALDEFELTRTGAVYGFEHGAIVVTPDLLVLPVEEV